MHLPSTIHYIFQTHLWYQFIFIVFFISKLSNIQLYLQFFERKIKLDQIKNVVTRTPLYMYPLQFHVKRQTLSVLLINLILSALPLGVLKKLFSLKKSGGVTWLVSRNTSWSCGPLCQGIHEPYCNNRSIHHGGPASWQSHCVAIDQFVLSSVHVCTQ